MRLLKEIRRHVRECRTQKAAAKVLGISPQYLGDILAGRREISAHVAELFSYTRVVSFRKNAGGSNGR